MPWLANGSPPRRERSFPGGSFCKSFKFLLIILADEAVGAKTGMPMFEGAFRLYVAGRSGESRRAEETVRRILGAGAAGGFGLEVIDVSVFPGRAEADGVSAVPALAPPRGMSGRRIVGDISQEEQIRALIDSWSK